jgi:hypothetical protein
MMKRRGEFNPRSLVWDTSALPMLPTQLRNQGLVRTRRHPDVISSWPRMPTRFPRHQNVPPIQPRSRAIKNENALIRRAHTLCYPAASCGDVTRTRDLLGMNQTRCHFSTPPEHSNRQPSRAQAPKQKAPLPCGGGALFVVFGLGVNSPARSVKTQGGGAPSVTTPLRVAGSRSTGKKGRKPFRSPIKRETNAGASAFAGTGFGTLHRVPEGFVGMTSTN